MTREKAIEILRCVPSSEIGDYSLDEISEALTMAIEALQKPPISQRRMYQAGYRQGREEALKQVTGKLNNPDDSLLTADAEACKEQKSKLDLISRAEAIEAIEIVDWYHQNRNKDMVHGANDDEHQAWYKADDVYRALEAVPPADRPRGEWIDKEELIDAINDAQFVYDGNEGEHKEYDITELVRVIFKDIISNLSSADMRGDTE